MNLFRFCLVLLAASICGQREIGFAMSEEIPYRILEAPYIDPKSTTVDYLVSVDRFLDRPQIEQLICRVIRDQNPASFRTVAVSIYHNLDRWIPGSTLFECERKQHIMADYVYNVSLTDKRDRLLIWRDPEGNLIELPKFVEFDHTKACK